MLQGTLIALYLSLPAALAEEALPARILPNRMVDPLPTVSADDDEEALLAVASFLRQCSLPPERCVLPLTPAAVRKHIQLMQQYAKPGER